MKAINWQSWRTRILLTIGAASIWLGAMFASQPSVIPPPLPIASLGQNRWVTTNDYHTSVTVSGAVYQVDIPKGFRCDLASLGRLDVALGIERDHPAIRRGALSHDWAYRTKRYPRHIADLILYQCCLDDGMEPAKARAVYEAVFIWGGEAWGR